MTWRILIAILLIGINKQIFAFLNSMGDLKAPSSTTRRRCQPIMKWSFGGPPGPPGSGRGAAGGPQENSASTSNLVGADGELYFHPSRPAKLKAPAETLGKSRIASILPSNNVIIPGISESLNIFEMRHRQLFGDLSDDGLFGMSYYSPQSQKLSLVGVLARVTNRRLMDDGRVSVVVEGVKRFYLEELLSEKPYIRGRVRVFQDYTENPLLLESLEWKAYLEVKVNMALIEILLPQKSFTPSPMLLQNRPYKHADNIRMVTLGDDDHELLRRSKFSFSIIEMLQIPPSLRLALMQEHVLEKRLTKSLRILQQGGQYLRDELISKGLCTLEKIQRIRELVIAEALLSKDATQLQNWNPENYVDGGWAQMVTMM